MRECEILVGDFLLRLPDIIGDPKADPPIKAIIPVSKTTWWSGVRNGRFPKPVKLGPNATAWRARDIKAFLDNLKSWS